MVRYTDVVDKIIEIKKSKKKNNFHSTGILVKVFEKALSAK